MDVRHITIATQGRGPLVREAGQRAVLVRRLVRALAAHELLLYSAADDHFHGVFACGAPEASAIAAHLPVILRASGVAEPLAPAHIEHVDDRGYLQHLVQYCVTQPERHDLGIPPHLYDGSCFFDMVGARLLEGFDPARIWEWLPRCDATLAVGHAGLDRLGVGSVAGVGLKRLEEAAKAVYAVRGFRGSDHVTEAARALFVRGAVAAGFTTAAVGGAAGVSASTVRRLRATLSPAPAARALGIQLWLRDVAVAADSGGRQRFVVKHGRSG